MPAICGLALGFLTQLTSALWVIAYWPHREVSEATDPAPTRQRPVGVFSLTVIGLVKQSLHLLDSRAHGFLNPDADPVG